jgi:hypothetical protein
LFSRLAKHDIPEAVVRRRDAVPAHARDRPAAGRRHHVITR